MSDVPQIRIGVTSLVQANWLAGKSFTDVVLGGLAGAANPKQEKIFLITSEEFPDPPPGVEVLRVLPVDLSIAGKVRRASLRARDRHPTIPGEWRFRERARLFEPSNPIHVARLAGIDVVIPTTSMLSPGVDVRRVGWIADFQHKFLPELFSSVEIAGRDEEFRELAFHADRLVLSSRTVQRHFAQFYPDQAHKSRVASFPSVFAFNRPKDAPQPIVAKYRLPEKFALVINQFWTHKNHRVVVEAAAICAAQGARIPIVMVGGLADYRDPNSSVVSDLLQRMVIGDVWAHTFVLGKVPFSDLVGLLRAAAVVVQPSRFEGWSTTVQDAKALGRPVLCSDIEVHREQAPDAVGFFDCDRPDELAKLLLKNWSELAAGPDVAREASALTEAEAMAVKYGKLLVRTCREAVFGSREA